MLNIFKCFGILRNKSIFVKYLQKNATFLTNICQKWACFLKCQKNWKCWKGVDAFSIFQTFLGFWKNESKYVKHFGKWVQILQTFAIFGPPCTCLLLSPCPQWCSKWRPAPANVGLACMTANPKLVCFVWKPQDSSSLFQVGSVILGRHPSRLGWSKCVQWHDVDLTPMFHVTDEAYISHESISMCRLGHASAEANFSSTING